MGIVRRNKGRSLSFPFSLYQDYFTSMVACLAEKCGSWAVFWAFLKCDELSLAWLINHQEEQSSFCSHFPSFAMKCPYLRCPLTPAALEAAVSAHPVLCLGDYTLPQKNIKALIGSRMSIKKKLCWFNYVVWLILLKLAILTMRSIHSYVFLVFFSIDISN